MGSGHQTRIQTRNRIVEHFHGTEAITIRAPLQGKNLPMGFQRPAPKRGALGFKPGQLPTLASSSFVVTFWILNCSACIAGSARNESLPK